MLKKRRLKGFKKFTSCRLTGWCISWCGLEKTLTQLSREVCSGCTSRIRVLQRTRPCYSWTTVGASPCSCLVLALVLLCGELIQVTAAALVEPAPEMQKAGAD